MFERKRELYKILALDCSELIEYVIICLMVYLFERSPFFVPFFILNSCNVNSARFSV